MHPPLAHHHYPSLNGWRGISILLVLATHLLPLGPKAWHINLLTGMMGMAIFFILSGFLITEFLLQRPDAGAFIVRRFARVLPLFYVYSLIVLWWFAQPPENWRAVLLFYANLPPQRFIPATAHLWSLCLEVQFYVAMALWCLLTRGRATWILVASALAITAYRIQHQAYASSVSYFRADEIMAGCILALALHNKLPDKVKWLIRDTPWPITAVLFVASCAEASGPLNYARPYLAAMLVGYTLLNPGHTLAKSLSRPWLAYVASISFALYIIHPFLAHTWLGEGDPLTRYLKRPLLFVALWGLAHLSTFYFEAPLTEWGKRITRTSPRDLVGRKQPRT
ncbi:acyltransferase [Aquabacterium sp.]|uniref:acyltransferase family protein n=1 Tax=Aquabacterium sp. TaxID=1872578 RepID=UPI0025C2763D|nr:acyltransferase [Aquabacterium sp.]